MLLQRVRVPLVPSAEGECLSSCTDCKHLDKPETAVTGAQGTGPREATEGGHGLR